MSEFTFEQEFRIRQFNIIVDNESDPNKLRTLAKELNLHNIAQATLYEQLIKHQWGLTTSDDSNTST